MMPGEVMSRFRSALATLKRLPLSSLDYPRARMGSTMPEPVRSRKESYNTIAARDKFHAAARTVASPEEITDLDEVLEWCFALTANERLVMWLVAAGRPKAWIGRRMDPAVSRYTVIRREKAAVEIIVQLNRGSR
jgi:hypothetical protein